MILLYVPITPRPAEGASPRPFVGVEQRYLKRWHVIVTAGWAIALAVSFMISVAGWGHDVAVGLHLLGLAVALGAVLLVDWHGLVWLAGLRTFRETLRVGEAAHPLVWFGLVLLVASGAFLDPDLGSGWTWLKQVAILALLNNGVYARRLGADLTRLPARLRSLDELPAGLRRRLVACLVISQTSWWVAAVVGYCTSVGRG